MGWLWKYSNGGSMWARLSMWVVVVLAMTLLDSSRTRSKGLECHLSETQHATNVGNSMPWARAFRSILRTSCVTGAYYIDHLARRRHATTSYAGKCLNATK